MGVQYMHIYKQLCNMKCTCAVVFICYGGTVCSIFSWYRSDNKQYIFVSIQRLVAHLELRITFRPLHNSFHMELKGLKRCFTWLETEEIEVSRLVTDRHSQIHVKTNMNREQPQIVHIFEIYGMCQKFALGRHNWTWWIKKKHCLY